MDYFFPHMFAAPSSAPGLAQDLDFTIDSGISAIRLLLRALDLPAGSSVAIPAFACEAMEEAVRTEKLTPILCDLKADGTFWTAYDFDQLRRQNVQVIILAHLYGFIHPDTRAIISRCSESGIKLIHDAAQSCGIDSVLLKFGNGVVYSFGPGKATTAALGAYIINMNPSLYTANVRQIKRHPLLWLISSLRARLFFLARTYGKGASWMDSLQDKFLGRLYSFLAGQQFYSMTAYQKGRALQAMALQSQILPMRRERNRLVLDAIAHTAELREAYPSNDGLNYKLVLYSEADLQPLCDRLLFEGIPYARLYEPGQLLGQKYSALPNLKKYGAHFLELSTEASIPIAEVERIAMVLKMHFQTKSIKYSTNNINNL